MKIGYIRISTDTQHADRQHETMQKYGVEKIFQDTASGTAARPQLQAMLDFIREGDVLYVESISRLGRSTRNLLEVVSTITGKGVQLISDKETIDTDTPQGRFMLTVFSALAEMERETTRERQAEGIAAAKARGVYKGRKPKAIDLKALRRECRRWRSGEQTATQTFRKLGISKTMFYKKVRELDL